MQKEINNSKFNQSKNPIHQIVSKLCMKYIPADFKHELESLINNSYPVEGSHAIDHACRVAVRSLAMASKMRLGIEDCRILALAGLCHDLGRCHVFNADNTKDHAVLGAHIFRNFAEAKGWINCQNVDRFRIQSIIRVHNKKNKCTDPLAMIIWDADKLDLMGNIGLLRTGIRSGELSDGNPTNNDNTETLYDALSRIRYSLTPENFLTLPGQEMAMAIYEEHVQLFDSVLQSLACNNLTTRGDMIAQFQENLDML